MNQTKAKIFLQEDRGHHEDDHARTYSHFRYGDDHRDHKSPFGRLYLLNEDTLAPKQDIRMSAEHDSMLILLPLVGELEISRDRQPASPVRPRQLYVCFLNKGDTIRLHNPYPEDLVNYIQAWVRTPNGVVKGPARVCDFDIVNRQNQLIELDTCHQEKSFSDAGIYIGRFQGRAEAIHRLPPRYQGCFLFVIQGAFEAAGRLLHPRDGLALWDLDEVDFEALSNDAILLVLDVVLD